MTYMRRLKGRFSAKGSEHKECDILMERSYFTLADIKLVVRAAKRWGVKADDLRFTFGQRFDLSSNPFNLSGMGLAKRKGARR